jgi:hypothetical protein
MDSVGMVINYPAQSPQVMAGALLRRFNNSGSNCVSANQTFRGWDRILGERVAVITDDVEATKPHVVTLKTAPGLGCWILAYQSVDEEGNVIMEQKADSLVYEEPDPALFSVSSDYRADKPSVVMGAVYKHAGIVPDADDLKRWTDQDTRWAKGQ